MLFVIIVVFFEYLNNLFIVHFHLFIISIHDFLFEFFDTFFFDFLHLQRYNWFLPIPLIIDWIFDNFFLNFLIFLIFFTFVYLEIYFECDFFFVDKILFFTFLMFFYNHLNFFTCEMVVVISNIYNFFLKIEIFFVDLNLMDIIEII